MLEAQASTNLGEQRQISSLVRLMCHQTAFQIPLPEEHERIFPALSQMLSKPRSLFLLHLIALDESFSLCEELNSNPLAI
uniref:Uncharacterized protein n=1 Tax=Nelumbo nucifera TaxID=4432 RepID=A0A822XEA6_NELNU|nr:TPA_asm: hypothetical protein HUJ06_019980 [Nelumbo nucifera]